MIERREAEVPAEGAPERGEKRLSDVEAEDGGGEPAEERGQARGHAIVGARGGDGDRAGGEREGEGRGRLERERHEKVRVAREGRRGLRADGQCRAAGERGPGSGEPALGERAAHEKRHEIAGGAHELAPLEEVADLVSRGDECDVGVDRKDAGRERADDGDGAAHAPPGPSDEGRGEHDDQVDPDELEPGEDPERALERDALDGDDPGVDCEGPQDVEGDGQEDGGRAPRGRPRLLAPVAWLSRARRRARHEEEARDEEEDMVSV